jgi:hypothetical protein
MSAFGGKADREADHLVVIPLAHQFPDGGAVCLIDRIVRPRVATGIVVRDRHATNGVPRFF